MANEEGERKLAAILSADVVGYSKLMADDERATVKTLKEYLSAIARVVDRHLGRVVNAPGDNILAEFRSAVEAVQAAHEIQHVLKGRNFELAPDRRMDFRIGVNLGDVIEEADGTIYGDGVNIAARMEALAEAGGICIASSIYEAVEGKLDFGFDYQGEHKVKNIDKPVNVYRVRADGGAETTPSTPAKSTTSKIGIFAGAGVALGLAIGGVVAWLSLDRAEPATTITGQTTPPPAAASGSSPASEYILVGNLVDFGGATSIIGRVYGQAKIDAANWINENGGINGRLIDFDTVEYSYLVPRAMAAYRKWQVQGVLAVQGHGTPDTMALVTHVSEDQVPYFSVSYAASITDPTGKCQAGSQAAPYNFFYGPATPTAAAAWCNGQPRTGKPRVIRALPNTSISATITPIPTRRRVRAKRTPKNLGSRSKRQSSLLCCRKILLNSAKGYATRTSIMRFWRTPRCRWSGCSRTVTRSVSRLS